MDTVRKSHRPHEGELRVQRRRQVPPEHGASIVEAIGDDMSRQHVEYYRHLPYLPLGAVDAEGRPWATILCAPETSAPTRERLLIAARVNPRDPFVAAVLSARPHPRWFAGVAIDFAERTRVKLAGLVDSATLDGAGTLTLSLAPNEHMGNCPKYITVRELRPTRRTPQTTVEVGRLPPGATLLLAQASTAFIATRHLDADPRESDMGFNHRGGPRGFVRYLEDGDGAHLVLPDYSGNRYYQSLGNVETDPVMGLAVPDFRTGDLLQVTGRARNLYDADAARLLPGATLVTLVTIDQAFLTRGALDLELVGDEELSPYNPRVRHLAAETPDSAKSVEVKARLVDITRETRKISTFTFALSAPADLVPGGHVILDFSGRVKRRYQHMNDSNPQLLNDDYIRTFTVSRLSADRRSIAITVKKSGLVSSYLHSLRLDRDGPIELDLKGFGGTFTCFDQGRVLPRMIWVAGGVGITPFLAMYRALRDSGQPMPEIELYYSCRLDELDLIREMTDIKVRVFDSKSAALPPATGLRAFNPRRLRASDLVHSADPADPAGLAGRTIFVCGPEQFMADVRSWLDGRLEPGRLRFESFAF